MNKEERVKKFKSMSCIERQNDLEKDENIKLELG